MTDRQSVTNSEICRIDELWYNAPELESMGLQDDRKGSRLRGFLDTRKQRRILGTVLNPAQEETAPLVKQNDRLQAFDWFFLPRQVLTGRLGCLHLAEAS